MFVEREGHLRVQGSGERRVTQRNDLHHSENLALVSELCSFQCLASKILADCSHLKGYGTCTG